MHLEGLKGFIEQNPTVRVEKQNGNIVLFNLWDDDTFVCSYPEDKDLSDLNRIRLPNFLSAVQHLDKKLIEFIWAPVDKDHPILNRNFDFLYLQKNYTACFTIASEVLKTLAKGFTPIKSPSVTEYRNLRAFRDFYNCPPYLSEYFKDKVPAVFNVTGDFENIDLISFAKTLNFHIHYFDRTSPFILIFDNYKREKYPLPCLSEKNQFPGIISSTSFDPILIDLFEVARKTVNTRLKFLFYYQVLEYCSYYHLNETLKKRLTTLMKKPDLISNASFYTRIIIEDFKDHFKNFDDSNRLEKLLLDFVQKADFRLEVSVNFAFFSKPHKFDGGFELDALVVKLEDFDIPGIELVKKVKRQLEKIRNVLVHIRESRENKVILPTERNSDFLRPYLYLIQRIAEHVAMNYE